MLSHFFEISLKTKKNFQFFDLTEKIQKLLKKSKVKNGILLIQTLHTTTALILNEKEPLLLKDFKETLEKLFPRDKKYNHDDFSKRKVNLCTGECANGHAHCKAIFLLPSLTLNVIEGKLLLGKWQRILFLELDGPRERKIQIQILGE
ncbi:YjbQ family protein [Candidatus Parcubacteria bacterium]|nr:YjbQ family protein [Candidatus Parcubacteria bacterium]